MGCHGEKIQAGHTRREGVSEWYTYRQRNPFCRSEVGMCEGIILFIRRESTQVKPFPSVERKGGRLRYEVLCDGKKGKGEKKSAQAGNF